MKRLPRGRHLVTLEDAGDYITKLPKAEHEAAGWQAAMEALVLVATVGRAIDVCAHWRHAGAEPRKSDPAIVPQRKRAKVYKVIR